MADITVTTAAVLIPEIWARETQQAREREVVLLKLVKRFDAEVKGRGDTVRIPNIARIPITTVPAGGAIVATANTETEEVMLIDQWIHGAVDIDDQSMEQAVYDLTGEYTKRLGTDLGEETDVRIHNLAQTTTNFTDGLNGVNLTLVRIVDAVRLLDTASAPNNDRFMVVTPGQKAQLLQIDEFTRFDAIPVTTSTSPLIKGMLGDIFGLRVFWTNLIQLDTGNRDGDGNTDEFLNLVFQRDGIGVGMQKMMKIETLARVKLSTQVVAHSLFGRQAIRDDHVIVLLTDNASG